MDDLGLQLVDELGLVLRRMMREARANVLQADKLIDESVGIFISHARNKRSFFMFMAQGLAGRAGRYRKASAAKCVILPANWPMIFGV